MHQQAGHRGLACFAGWCRFSIKRRWPTHFAFQDTGFVFGDNDLLDSAFPSLMRAHAACKMRDGEPGSTHGGTCGSGIPPSYTAPPCRPCSAAPPTTLTFLAPHQSTPHGFLRGYAVTKCEVTGTKREVPPPTAFHHAAMDSCSAPLHALPWSAPLPWPGMETWERTPLRMASAGLPRRAALALTTTTQTGDNDDNRGEIS